MRGVRPFLGEGVTLPANIEKTFDQITKAVGHGKTRRPHAARDVIN